MAPRKKMAAKRAAPMMAPAAPPPKTKKQKAKRDADAHAPAPVQVRLPLDAPADALPELRRLLPSLGEAIRELRVLMATLRPPGAPPRSHDGDDAALEAAANCMAEAHQTIRAALATLPRDPEYSRVAAQLREIASVSPSLSEWLSEVPKLTMPLGTSIQALEAAALSLEEAELALRRRGA